MQIDNRGRSPSPHGNFARAAMHRRPQSFVWHQGVDKFAVESLSRTSQRLELNRAVGFRFLESLDALRAYRQSPRELNAGHAEGVTDGPYPAFRGRIEFTRFLQRYQALVESALCRRERLDAHRQRAAGRVEVEERVGTGFAVQRARDHRRIRDASAAAATARTVGLIDVCGATVDRVASSCGGGGGGGGDADGGGGGAATRATRLPLMSELRDAKELEKALALHRAEAAREQARLWAEMDRVSAATDRDARAARVVRGKAASLGDSDDETK